jgi:hypothetical protein
MWWINSYDFELKKKFSFNEEERIKNEKEIEEKKKSIVQDEFFDKNKFTLEKFENLKINENNKHWFVFFRNFIYQEFVILESVKKKIIEMFLRYNKNIKSEEIDVDMEKLKKYVCSTLFIDSRAIKPKFAGKRFKKI